MTDQQVISFKDWLQGRMAAYQEAANYYEDKWDQGSATAIEEVQEYLKENNI